jgi:hypothetical protein
MLTAFNNICIVMIDGEICAITDWGLDYCQNKKWANILMMFWGMMFAGVVGMIENTVAPKILELALSVPSFKPMKALIN